MKTLSDLYEEYERMYESLKKRYAGKRLSGIVLRSDEEKINFIVYEDRKFELLMLKKLNEKIKMSMGNFIKK